MSIWLALGVHPSTLRIENGVLIHELMGAIYYGKSAELAELADKSLLPEKFVLKDPRQFKVIGRSVLRLDAFDKPHGQAGENRTVRCNSN